MKRTRILFAAALIACLSAASAPAFNRMRADGVDLGRAGLLAENSQVTVTVALNLSNRDDLEQLEAGMLLYDAFFRWCRDATEETHNWPAAGAGKPS